MELDFPIDKELLAIHQEIHKRHATIHYKLETQTKSTFYFALHSFLESFPQVKQHHSLPLGIRSTSSANQLRRSRHRRLRP